MTAGASEALWASRLARLQVELAEECMGLDLSEPALEEVLSCRWMEAHEGRWPSYGAIIAPENGNSQRFAGLELPNAAVVMVADAPLNDLRRFADGRTSFIIRPAVGPPALAIDSGLSGDEQSLATFSRTSDATIVQRLPSGRTRLFYKDHVYSSDGGGVWLNRPSSARYHESVQIRVAGDRTETARAILDLCVHSLSPAGIGASLVWYPSGVPPFSHALDRGAEIVPPTLAVTSGKERPAIVHALSQLDRAVIVDPTGRLAALNVLLLAPDVPDDVRFDGGTRHNSAGRFSAAEPDALVFVVSADGPVTVFQAGEVIASLRAAIYLETRRRECTDCQGSGLASQSPDVTNEAARNPCEACDGAGVIEWQVELRSDHTSGPGVPDS